jgi:[acyl-carrier-protein] S-malonyltransferase/trans-AT polyketide synthase/acyltransferase/oxidoreductase domain-containing protein
MSPIIVFPGQGSQRNGMAQDFYNAHPIAQAVFKEASDALNLDMARLCFEDDERLNFTEYTQPAIVTSEVAMYRTLQETNGLQGRYFGGHSLGEYTALVAAGVMPLSSAVRVVRERGRRMQEAVPAGIGAMAAIIQPELSMGLLEHCIHDLRVDIANHNAPNQVVISGEVNDVQTAIERYQDSPVGMRSKVRMLTVSAPFHSQLMSGIEPGFRSLLFDASSSWDAPKSRVVVSNTTGEMHDGTIEGLVERLTKQISGTVRWVDNMITLCALDADRVIEIGPGRPLRGFFRGMSDHLQDRPLDSITNLVSAQRALPIPEDRGSQPIPAASPPTAPISVQPSTGSAHQTSQVLN